MSSRNVFVVGDDEQGLKNGIHEGFTRGTSAFRVSHLHANKEFCHRGSRDLASSARSELETVCEERIERLLIAPDAKFAVLILRHVE